MGEFLSALGLVFVIEGLIFAAFPGHAKKAVASVLETPEGSLRMIGLGSALGGLLLVALARWGAYKQNVPLNRREGGGTVRARVPQEIRRACAPRLFVRRYPPLARASPRLRLHSSSPSRHRRKRAGLRTLPTSQSRSSMPS